MKLIRFRVTNFRSIKDSTWIDCSDVTNIIGINEAGKSNALLALWKFNPTDKAEINLLEDLPRNEYSSLKNSCQELPFIEVIFRLEDDDELLKKLIKITGRRKEELSEIHIKRFYSGEYSYEFPHEETITELPSKEFTTFIEEKINAISKISIESKVEKHYKATVESILNCYIDELQQIVMIDKNLLQEFISNTENTGAKPSAKSEIQPIVNDVLKYFREQMELLSRPPIRCDEVWQQVFSLMPNFVYYSNYGNLDTEIYLPHVIDNLERNDITGVVAAKVRTLKVLFDFIGLNPKEILELGNDSANLSQDEIEKFNKKKEERTVLLNSASSKLTKEFKQWWKQGNYVFDLRADGKFFKIWVSDEKRPEKVVLEARSTGLQWFLSFYLVFLTQTKTNLKNTIILLDEAGLSLHPLAQKDLLAFFKNLATTNQIIHTTHSPFLVDTNNIDSVKIAYIDNDGYTVISNDLRANSDPKRDTSVYAVHAALGLSVSDIMLNGCQPVIVEGASDQYYLNAIKTYLIASGLFKPSKDIVFMPAGGVKGVSAIASIVSAKGELPYVIIDGDTSGTSFKDKLKKDLYKDEEHKLICLKDFVEGLEAVEIEDIIPFSCISKAIDRLFRNVDDFEFDEVYDSKKSLLSQIEEYARMNRVQLPKGYKVEIAKFAKQKIINMSEKEKEVDIWIKIFEQIK
ncbi:AAA family ATPase [uncultured Phascolarctobacterium sp.]|jgi:predicted ATP-dependent endonuclease of OLD family|uniref:AAA family ATPase n=1 Tax=uncultured Phascolarctobacterium sp. TaxID=512296 RepID=UPI0025D615E6|nr:AAA family ATPase [uncultured Phascolarctobacterium sp.]